MIENDLGFIENGDIKFENLNKRNTCVNRESVLCRVTANAENLRKVLGSNSE